MKHGSKSREGLTQRGMLYRPVGHFLAVRDAKAARTRTIGILERETSLPSSL